MVSVSSYKDGDWIRLALKETLSPEILFILSHSLESGSWPGKNKPPASSRDSRLRASSPLTKPITFVFWWAFTWFHFYSVVAPFPVCARWIGKNKIRSHGMATKGLQMGGIIWASKQTGTRGSSETSTQEARGSKGGLLTDTSDHKSQRLVYREIVKE